MRKLLVIRPFRETCLAFYSKFKHFEVVYLTVGEQNVGTLPKNFHLIKSKYLFGRLGESNLGLNFILGIGKAVKESDVVCITDTYYFYNLQAVFWAKIYGKPIVDILWMTIPRHITSIVPPYSLITKAVVGSSSLFILRNKSALKFAKSIGVPEKKIRIIYKGVDLSHFHPLKSRKKGSLINILYVGRIIKSKGISDLVWAVKKLKEEGFTVKLRVCGGKSYVPYLKLAEVYRNADIFASPSRDIYFLGRKIWEEYFSYTLMEALASGLPVVAADTVGVREEVGMQNFFVKSGDREGLLTALRKLVSDKALRENLGKINRKRAEALFDAGRQAEKTEEAIENAIK